MAINLLPRDLQQERQRKSRQIISTVISIVLLLIFVAGAGILFSSRVAATRDLDEVTQNLNDLTKRLEDQRVVEGLLQAIHLKLDKASSTLAQSESFSVVLEQANDFTTEQVEITDVNLIEDDRFLVGGKADSLSELANYVGQFNQNGLGYETVTVDKIAFNDTDFRYDFVVSFEYSEDTANEAEEITDADSS